MSWPLYAGGLPLCAESRAQLIVLDQAVAQQGGGMAHLWEPRLAKEFGFSQRWVCRPGEVELHQACEQKRERVCQCCPSPHGRGPRFMTAAEGRCLSCGVRSDCARDAYPAHLLPQPPAPRRSLDHCGSCGGLVCIPCCRCENCGETSILCPSCAKEVGPWHDCRRPQELTAKPQRHCSE